MFYTCAPIYRTYKVKETSKGGIKEPDFYIIVENADDKIRTKDVQIYHEGSNAFIVKGTDGDKILLNRKIDLAAGDSIWRKVSGLNIGKDVPQIARHMKIERDYVVIAHERLHNYNLFDLDSIGFGNMNVMLFSAKKEGTNTQLRNRPLKIDKRLLTKRNKEGIVIELDLDYQHQWDALHKVRDYELKMRISK